MFVSAGGYHVLKFEAKKYGQTCTEFIRHFKNFKIINNYVTTSETRMLTLSLVDNNWFGKGRTRA